MYTLRLLYAFEGYRRIAWLVLGAVTIWRAGYFFKGYRETFFAWHGWLEWRKSWLNEFDEFLLYIVMTLVEIAAVMAMLVAVIECIAWARRGFNPEFHKNLPEPPREFKVKLLKTASQILGWLSVGPVGFLIIVLLIEIRRHGRVRIDDEGWVIVAALVLASVICWITASSMSKKARELNEKRR